MDKKQVADREQFRRYAEAALSGTIASGLKCQNFLEMAFNVATDMMLAEGQAFERYQLLALEAITANERNRHAKRDL
jgi:hypothetical protein